MLPIEEASSNYLLILETIVKSIDKHTSCARRYIHQFRQQFPPEHQVNL